MIVDKDAVIGFSDGIKFREVVDEDYGGVSIPTHSEFFDNPNNLNVDIDAAMGAAARRHMATRSTSWCSWLCSLFKSQKHAINSSKFVMVHGHGILYVDSYSEVVRAEQRDFDETDFL